MSKKITACLMLVAVTMVWGATFPIIHNAVKYADSTVFVFYRFLIAGLILLPFVWLKRRTLKFTDLKYGLVLGLLNSCIFITQTLAIHLTGSYRSAFLTTTYAIFVPLLSPLFGFPKPSISEWISALICIVGSLIMTGAKITAINSGDLLAISAAIGIALTILFINFTHKRQTDYLMINFYQVLFTIIPPAVMSFYHNGINIHYSSSFWLGVWFCALFATAIAFIAQLKYQNVVGANKTALIFSLESVFAAIFAHLSGEPITLRVLIGGAIILFSIILADLLSAFRSRFLHN